VGSIKLLNTLTEFFVRSVWNQTSHIVADVEFRCKLYL